MKTRVLLVDDHQLMREGLRMLLEAHDELQVVGEAEDGRSALDLARSRTADVIVMDVGLPGLNGIEATRCIIAEVPQIKVIALSMHSDRRYVMEMINAGASAYLLKNSASEELLLAIRAVVAGDSFLSPGIASTVIGQIRKAAGQVETSAYGVLTNREREVLQLLAEGRTSKQIAGELHLAHRTIDTHRQEIMRKLDLHSVAELTKYAVREGLTSLDG